MTSGWRSSRMSARDALVVGVRVQAVDAGGVDDGEAALADVQAPFVTSTEVPG